MRDLLRAGARGRRQRSPRARRGDPARRRGPRGVHRPARLRAGHGAIPRVRRSRGRARGLGRDVRHRRDDGGNDVRRASRQLAARGADLAAHDGRDQCAEHRRDGPDRVRRSAVRCRSRCRRADLALVRGDRAHVETGPQFRLPDHVGAHLWSARTLAHADGLRADGSRRRAVVLRAVPARHAAVAQVLPVDRRKRRAGREGRGRSRGRGEELCARRRCSCTSSRRASSGPTCS